MVAQWECILRRNILTLNIKFLGLGCYLHREMQDVMPSTATLCVLLVLDMYFLGDYWMDGVIFLVNLYRPRRIPLDTRKPGDAEDLSTEQSEEMLIAFGRNLWAAADVPRSLVIVQCRSVILER